MRLHWKSRSRAEHMSDQRHNGRSVVWREIRCRLRQPSIAACLSLCAIATFGAVVFGTFADVAPNLWRTGALPLVGAIFSLLAAALWVRDLGDGVSGSCLGCGYGLQGHGVTSGRCPECGEQIVVSVDRGALASLLRFGPAMLLAAWGGFLALVGVVALVLLGFNLIDV